MIDIGFFEFTPADITELRQAIFDNGRGDDITLETIYRLSDGFTCRINTLAECDTLTEFGIDILNSMVSGKWTMLPSQWVDYHVAATEGVAGSDEGRIAVNAERLSDTAKRILQALGITTSSRASRDVFTAWLENAGPEHILITVGALLDIHVKRRERKC